MPELEHPNITRCLNTGYPYQRRRQAPVCDFCDQEVQTEQYLPILGFIICEDCVRENMRWTENWEPDSDE